MNHNESLFFKAPQNLTHQENKKTYIQKNITTGVPQFLLLTFIILWGGHLNTLGGIVIESILYHHTKPKDLQQQPSTILF